MAVLAAFLLLVVFTAVIWPRWAGDPFSLSGTKVVDASSDKCPNGNLLKDDCKPATATNDKCPNGNLLSNNCAPAASGGQGTTPAPNATGNGGTQGTPSGNGDYTTSFGPGNAGQGSQGSAGSGNSGANGTPSGGNTVVRTLPDGRSETPRTTAVLPSLGFAPYDDTGKGSKTKSWNLDVPAGWYEIVFGVVVTDHNNKDPKTGQDETHDEGFMKVYVGSTNVNVTVTDGARDSKQGLEAAKAEFCSRYRQHKDEGWLLTETSVPPGWDGTCGNYQPSR